LTVHDAFKEKAFPIKTDDAAAAFFRTLAPVQPCRHRCGNVEALVLLQCGDDLLLLPLIPFQQSGENGGALLVCRV